MKRWKKLTLSLFFIVIAITFIGCVNDETAPVFSNIEDIEYYVGDDVPDYIGDVTVLDNTDGDLTSEIIVDSSQVDLQTPGTYVVTLTVTDQAGNSKSETINVIVIMPDETAPVFANVTDMIFFTSDGTPDYVNNITAIDDIDGDLTSEIQVDSSQVNLDEDGTYTVSLSVTDEAGNMETTSYQITVLVVLEGEIVVPNQDDLADENLVFYFSGEYDTGSIGIAEVTGNFFIDGTYEVYATIWGYEAFVVYGDWTCEDGVITIVNEPNEAIYVSDIVGDVYSFDLPFQGSEITISATMNGIKAILLQEKIEPPVVVDPSPVLLLTRSSDDKMFHVNLYDDESAVIWITDSDQTSEGTWSYDETNGFSITINETSYEVTNTDGVYSFTGYVLTYGREFSIAETDIQRVIDGYLDINYEQPTESLVNNYADWTAQEWSDMWLELDATDVGSFTWDEYPDTAIDSLFLDTIPVSYLEPVAAEDRGVVLKYDYHTYLYDFNETFEIPEEEWQVITKSMYIYLPAGYNDQTQYNVYYLMHGAGGNETNWFSMNFDHTASAVGEGDFIKLVDYLIANGMMEPTIFVSTTTNVNTDELSEATAMAFNTFYEISDFPFELENDIIPLVETSFSTYLISSSYEDIVASRYHRAFAGLSMGAYVVWNTMPYTMDVMAFYAPISNGCDMDMENSEATMHDIYIAMTSGDNTDHPAGFIFSAVGMKENWDPQARTFNQLYLDSLTDDSLTYGVNFFDYNPQNGAHTVRYFILGFYNSMQVFFNE